MPNTEAISFDDFLSKFKECAQIVEEPLATTSIIEAATKNAQDTDNLSR
jgi:hypothetical protein